MLHVYSDFCNTGQFFTFEKHQFEILKLHRESLPANHDLVDQQYRSTKMLQ